ncbi:MAG: hypothetical protein M0009_17370 [Deltaproteobacteria bacterium]|nr:hypothetical protein [Deltaproteobacteria bacterium]
MKKYLLSITIILFLGANLYAADGNLIVNGNVGIGTTTPAAKLDVGGKLQVDANGNVIKINNVPTSFPAAQGAAGTYLQNNGSGGLTWQPVNTSASYMQGGHYGYCASSYYATDSESGGVLSENSCSPNAPAYCSGYTCLCPAGFTIISTTVPYGTKNYCIKN